MVLMLHCQPGARQHLLKSDSMTAYPDVALAYYTDAFGNTCTRLEAPAGTLRVTADAIMADDGLAEPAHESAIEHPIAELPGHTLQFLLPSRYCETDLLIGDAWRLFGHLAPGWSRVQAICDFVHHHVTFGYAFARPTKTALETFREGRGVCRDLAHLAISFCRCLNIPARYCTTYLGDIGVPRVDAPMDFAGCMEVYLGDAWYCFDPRNNARRIGRIVIARGRDAADVAISTAFGGPYLEKFLVWTDEVSDAQARELLRVREPEIAMAPRQRRAHA